jgi:hypothetical protein
MKKNPEQRLVAQLLLACNFLNLKKIVSIENGVKHSISLAILK